MSAEQHASGAFTCAVDFYADETLKNPVAAYDQMLNLGPVVWLEKNQIHAICGYNELTQCLRDHKVFQSGKGVSIDDDVNKLLIGSTLHSDPPMHDTTRAITFSPLTPKALESVKEQVAEEAQFIAEKMARQQGFDAAQELAPHLPLTIVRDLVGLGEHGKKNMLEWGAATFELMGNPHERRETALENMKNLRAFLEDEDTLAGLSDEGWAKKATTRGIEQGFEPSRAAELMRDYIAPSLDTTISAIGYGIKLFAEFPQQWAKLRADRRLIKNAIEEIVRLNTPIRAFARYVAQDCEVGGVKLKQGTRVLMVYGAANRDPKRFPDPHRFDVERNVRGHVGFSHGIHACLGMHLARLEMACLFDALADRIKRFELNGPAVASINSTIHSWASVPVRAITT